MEKGGDAEPKRETDKRSVLRPAKRLRHSSLRPFTVNRLVSECRLGLATITLIYKSLIDSYSCIAWYLQARSQLVQILPLSNFRRPAVVTSPHQARMHSRDHSAFPSKVQNFVVPSRLWPK